MGKISKTFAVLLTLLIATSCLTLLTTIPANAQTISEPSIPEFALKLVDDSYDVPPTSTVNPYTGKTETSGGYHVQGYLEVQIRIKNQPAQGVFYQVQTKGHYAENWANIEYWIGESGSYNPRIPYKEQDYIAEYTILKWHDSGNLPREGEIDFRVQALIGTPIVQHTSDHLDFYNTWATFSFNGTASGWSNTQTINLATDAVSAYNTQDTWATPTVPEATSSPTSFPTVTPTSTDSLPNMSPTSSPNIDSELTLTLTWVIIGALVVSVISLLLYVRHLKRRLPKN
ncbi:MAG: hypothetical protein QM398_04735 [Thermoproteota archaeon]|nr:hypothetical protein [Thermoproteota archaeon]